MQPDPVGDKPFFRREAELYRRQRHLGEIVLLRPLSLRLVTLYPVAVVALLVFAASQVDLRLEFAALVERSSGRELSLTMDPGAAEHIRPGQSVDYRIAGGSGPAGGSSSADAGRLRGQVIEIATAPCSASELLFLRARSSTAGKTCFRVILTPESSPPALPAESPVTAQMWSPPIDYLSHILDD